MGNTKLSFFSSAFYYTIGVIMAQGTTFIALLILAKLMSPEDYAIISLYALWASIFGTIIGLQAFYSLNNAKLDYGVSRMNEYTSVTFGLGLLTLVVFLAFVFIFQDAFVAFLGFPFEVVLFCVFQGAFSFCMMHLSNKYRVLNRPLPFVIWSSLISILRLILSIAFVSARTTEKYLGDIYGSFIAYAAIGTAAACVVIIQGKKLYNREMWKYCLLISAPFVFTNLSTLLLGQSSRYILDRMVGRYESGIYSYVYNIGLIGTAIWTACNNAWNVWYFDKTYAGKKKEINELYNKYSSFVTLFSACIVLLSPDIIRVLGGNEYTDGVKLVPLLIAGCYFMFLYSFPVAYETYKKKTAYIAIGTVGAAGLNIALNIALIPCFGGMGATIATVLSYLVLFIYHYIIVRYAVKGFELSFRQLLLPGLFIFAITAVTYLTLSLGIVRLAAVLIMLIFCVKIFLQSKDIMME